MTEYEAGLLVEMLVTAYPDYPWGEATKELYRGELLDFEEDQARSAVGAWVRVAENDKPPKIGQLVGSIRRGSLDDQRRDYPSAEETRQRVRHIADPGNDGKRRCRRCLGLLNAREMGPLCYVCWPLARDRVYPNGSAVWPYAR